MEDDLLILAREMYLNLATRLDRVLTLHYVSAPM